MKAREEKGELAAKVAELQARLKDAEEAVQPAPSPKVMRTICFSKVGKIQDSRSVAR